MSVMKPGVDGEMAQTSFYLPEKEKKFVILL